MCDLPVLPNMSPESLLESPPVSPPDQSSYWLGHIENCENSGLNQAAYCRLHDLKYNVFHYWKRKLRKPSNDLSQTKSKPVDFVEVGSLFPVGSNQSFRSTPVDCFRLWVGGVCVEVGNKFDSRSLSQLLTCLRTL